MAKRGYSSPEVESLVCAHLFSRRDIWEFEMPSNRLINLVGLPVIVVAALSGSHAQPTNALTVERFMNMHWISSVQISPDSFRVIYTIDAFDRGQNVVSSSLFSISSSGGEPRKLADGVSPIPVPERTAPMWSPDGKQIAYLSRREEGNQIWLIKEGEVRSQRLTSAPADITYFRWSPDGRQIAYIATIPPAAAPNGKLAPQADSESPPATTHIFIVDVEIRKTTQLTEKEYAPILFSWSPDGSQIAFSAGGVFKANVSDRKVTKLVSRPGTNGNPIWSPDGTTIAFVSNHGDPTRQVGLSIVPAEGGALRELEQGFDAVHSGSPPRYVAWSADSKILFFTGLAKMRGHLYAINISNGQIRPVTSGSNVSYPFSLSADSRTMAFVRSDPRTPGEVYISPVNDFHPKQLTRIDSGLGSVDLGKIEEVHWKSTDRMELEGLLAKPVGYEAGKKYPLLVLMEGTFGSFDMSFSGRVSSDLINWFPYQQQIFAGAGYAVFMPNPRGSWGYGEAFVQSGLRDFGVGPYHDIMSGIDSLVDAGIVDTTRIGIMGSGSFDANRVAYAITHTDRFKAASVGPVPIFNIESWYGQTGAAGFFNRIFGGPPWKVPEQYRAISPLGSAEKLGTPTLIFSTVAVPWSRTQADEMKTALTVNKVPYQYVVYPDDKFANAVFLTPVSLADALTRNLAWFNRWLKPAS